MTTGIVSYSNSALDDPHGVPLVIKTIMITSKVRGSIAIKVVPITILITNQTKPPIDLACFDCLRETETALDSFAGNRTQLSSTGSELVEEECQQIKSNENEITTHLNGSLTVPFTMTIKTIMISNQDCFDGEWNALPISLLAAKKSAGPIRLPRGKLPTSDWIMSVNLHHFQRWDMKVF